MVAIKDFRLEKKTIIHTVQQRDVISFYISASFRRHFVGKTVRNF